MKFSDEKREPRRQGRKDGNGFHVFSMFFEEKENRDSKAVPVAYEIVTG